MYPKFTAIAAVIATCLVCFPAFANDIARNICAACHGADGNSVNPEWPNLAGQHAKYIVQQLQAYKSGVRENPNMSAMVTNLSDGDILAIGNYYAAGTPMIGSIDTDQIADGEALYRGGNMEKNIPACMACHGPSGAGNPGAAYPALRGQHAKYTSIQLNAYRSGERKTGAEKKATMQNIALKLSDAEIESVSRYIHALH